MGGISASKPKIPDITIERVENLKSRCICKACVQRYTSLDTATINQLVKEDPYSHNCSACGGISSVIGNIKNIVSQSIGDYSYHDVQIEIPPPVIKPDQKICKEFDLSTSCNIKNWLKAKLNSTLPHTDSGPILMLRIAGARDVTCRLRWPDVYVVGRYLKESRRVSNSRNFAGHSVASVESELSKFFSKYIKAKSVTFNSSGREDADVRMIESGRPFALRFSNPEPLSVPANIEEYIEDFNKIIPNEAKCEHCVSAINCYATITPPDMEPKHMKKYRCVVSFARPVSDDELSHLLEVKDIVLHQRTPSRVAHRREIIDRERTIISLGYKKISPRFVALELETSKGTYIKEFVNSDFGRTVPSLGDLISPEDPVPCQLLQLDVVFVADD